MILARLKTLLGSLQGRFETVEEDIPTIRGRVDWSRYARVHLPRGRSAELPCVYSDFQVDRSLLGAIRYALEIQLQSLNTQRHHGLHVHRLIELCTSLLQVTGKVTALPPKPSQIAAWMRRPMKADALTEGVLAIEWTLEGRGLAGTNELAGVPWILSMDRFFEAWVETVFGEFGRRLGSRMRSARSDGTRQRIQWTPRFTGAQESLVPDVVLEHGDTTWIVDAKYKRHWEEWQLGIWNKLDEELRNEHRHDFHQILAYANVSRTDRTITCLCYPCEPSTWKEMKERNRVLYRAYMPSAQRSLEIWVTAIPMDTDVGQIADLLLTHVK
ncbi:MAG: McrC family protein [Bryobacterales bacterium]|nr:McrC family protein [Bryobacterales bacterium]